MTNNSTKTECAEKQSNKDWPMKGIEEPHAHDVMYGRGGGTNHRKFNISPSRIGFQMSRTSVLTLDGIFILSATIIQIQETNNSVNSSKTTS